MLQPQQQSQQPYQQQQQQRILPWRHHCPIDLHEDFKNSLSTILYLVHETGPTSFILMDQQCHQYSINIGQSIKCSCSINKNDHCMHTLYTMIKIFNVPLDNPLLWQASYLESEIGNITQMRYNNHYTKTRYSNNFKRHLLSIKNIDITHDDYLGLDNKHELSYNSDYTQVKSRALTVSGSKREKLINKQAFKQPLGLDQTCWICHEIMNENDGLTYCRTYCGNNFHIRCCFIWAKYKHDHKEIIACPACRCDWGENALSMLAHEQYEFDNRLLIHKGHICQGCKNGQPTNGYASSGLSIFLSSPKHGKAIRGKLFHCLYCENYELCERCYLSFEHYEHNKFLVKENNISKWIPAKSREKLYLQKQKNKYYSHDVRHLGISEKNEDLDKHLAILSANQYEGNLNIYLGEKKISDDMCLDYDISLEEYILSCFPNYNFEEEILPNKAGLGTPTLLSKNNSKLKKVCAICKQVCDHTTQAKRLFCGHLVHPNCIIKYLCGKNYICPEDLLDILKGFKAIIGVNSQINDAIKTRPSTSVTNNTSDMINLGKNKNFYFGNVGESTRIESSFSSNSYIEDNLNTRHTSKTNTKFHSMPDHCGYTSTKVLLNSLDKAPNAIGNLLTSNKNIRKNLESKVPILVNKRLDKQFQIVSKLNKTVDSGVCDKSINITDKEVYDIDQIKQYKNYYEKSNGSRISCIKENQIEELSTRRDFTTSELSNQKTVEEESREMFIKACNSNNPCSNQEIHRKYLFGRSNQNKTTPLKRNALLIDTISQGQNTYQINSNSYTSKNPIKPNPFQYSNHDNLSDYGERDNLRIYTIVSKKRSAQNSNGSKRPKTGMINGHRDEDSRNLGLMGTNNFIITNSSMNYIEYKKSMRKNGGGGGIGNNRYRYHNNRNRMQIMANDNISHTATIDSIDKIVDLEEL